MTIEEMKEVVLKEIEGKGYVTHAGLERLFEENDFDYHGGIDLQVQNPDTQIFNVVLWTGWSSEAYQVVCELFNEGMIIREPCEAFLYVTEGKTLPLPVYKPGERNRSWMPIVYKA